LAKKVAIEADYAREKLPKPTLPTVYKPNPTPEEISTAFQIVKDPQQFHIYNHGMYKLLVQFQIPINLKTSLPISTSPTSKDKSTDACKLIWIFFLLFLKPPRGLSNLSNPPNVPLLEQCGPFDGGNQ
jgi:hypothetical protein